MYNRLVWRGVWIEHCLLFLLYYYSDLFVCSEYI